MVDDDPDDRMILEQAFTELRPGFGLLQLRDGKELMDYLTTTNAEELAELIVLDLNMPKMGGKEVLMELKSDHRFKQIPVIVYTTSTNPVEKKEVLAMGANGFITKPYQYTSILQFISAITSLFCQDRSPAAVQSFQT